MILDLRTESEGRIVVTKVGPKLTLAVSGPTSPNVEPAELTRDEVGTLCLALEVMRDTKA